MYTYLQKAVKVASRKRVGDVQRIAEATGFSSSHVSNTLAGRRYNPEILTAAYDITRRRMTNDVKLASIEA